LEILRYLESNPQARAANLLGVSFGYLNTIVSTWAGVKGQFPIYPGSGPVSEWLSENTISVNTLCKLFNNNYKLTAAYLQVPYQILRKSITQREKPRSTISIQLENRDAEALELIEKGIRPLSKVKFEEYLEQNATRKANEMKPLTLDIRVCLKCGIRFESAGDRLCGCTVGESSDYFWETWK